MNESTKDQIRVCVDDMLADQIAACHDDEEREFTLVESARMSLDLLAKHLGQTRHAKEVLTGLRAELKDKFREAMSAIELVELEEEWDDREYPGANDPDTDGDEEEEADAER